MNSDDVTKVLGRVVPDAPSPDAWAGNVIRGVRRRRRAGMAAVAALAVLALPVGMLLVQKPPRTAVPAEMRWADGRSPGFSAGPTRPVVP